MIAVLIVDDQPLHRLGLRMQLESNPDTEVVGEAGNGADAVRQTARSGLREMLQAGTDAEAESE